MNIYIEQIPDTVNLENYTDDTEFILDDSRPERDPVTFQLMRKKRVLIWPEDVVKAKMEGKPEDYFSRL